MDIDFVIPVTKEKEAVRSSPLIDKGPESPEKEGGKIAFNNLNFVSYLNLKKQNASIR